MKEGLIKLINLFMEICFGEALGIADGASITFTGNQAVYSGLWKMALTVADSIIEPIAVCIVVLFFLLSIIDKLSSENFNIEQVIKELIKLFAGVYLVTNSLNLIVDLIELGNGILTRVQSHIVGVTPNTDILLSSLGNENVIVLMITAVLIALVMFVQLIVFLIMKGVCLVRLIDITLRAAMSPIALADMFSGSFLNSHAMNFIRSFAAVCLQGVLIAIIASFVPVGINAVLANSSFDSGMELLGAVVKTIPVTIACLMIILKSGSIAKEVLGAR